MARTKKDETGSPRDAPGARVGPGRGCPPVNAQRPLAGSTEPSNTTEKTATTIDGKTLAVLPSPRQINLKSLDDVRLEMSKVYRDMRKQKIEPADGTKLVYVLSQIGKIIQLDEVAARLEAVERTLKLRRLR